jgi:hypothetical protein
VADSCVLQRFAWTRRTGQPVFPFCIKFFHGRTAQTGESLFDSEAILDLQVCKVSVAFREAREQLVIQLDDDSGVNRVEAILFVDRLPPDNCPSPLPLLEEVVESADACNVDLYAIQGAR